MYIHVCKYIYVFIGGKYKSLCKIQVSMYIHVCKHTYTCISRQDLHFLPGLQVYMRLIFPANPFLYICICTHIYVHTKIYIYIHIHICIHTYKSRRKTCIFRLQTCISRLFLCQLISVHTYTHKFLHTCIPTHTHAYHLFFYIHTNIYTQTHIDIYTQTSTHLGWLRLVGSFKLQVYAKEPYKRDDILQKRPIIVRSVLRASYTRTHAHQRTHEAIISSPPLCKLMQIYQAN